MSNDHENYSKELELLDFIKPLWKKKYYIMVYTAAFYIISFSSLYIIKEFINQNSINYYHQDIKFNSLLEKSQFESLVSLSRVKKIYNSENFGITDINSVQLSLMNNSSRYDEMKNFIINDTEELLINLLNKQENGENQNISKESLWQNYLELDSDYYQIIFSDPKISKFKSQKIVSHLIRDFNDEMNKKNALKIDQIPLISFNTYQDNSEFNLGYLTNRLNNISKIVKDNEADFVNLGADMSEFDFIINILNSQIYALDNRHLELIIDKLDFQISQKMDLKKDLTSLYQSFSNNAGKSIEKGIDTQVTVDAITQLIDLGKDISSQDFSKTIMQSLYQIDIDIKSLQLELYEINSMIDLYQNELTKNPAYTIEMIIKKSNEVIDKINSYTSIVNDSKSDLAVYEIGNILEKKDLRYEFNIVSLSLVASIIFFFSYIISVYLREANIYLK